MNSSDERSWCWRAKINREHMMMSLEQMEAMREFEDVKDMPPLDIIHYRDLMETAWSWDRLLPWDSGFVLLEDYLDYLNEFFQRNAPAILRLNASATRCLEIEEKLSSCAEGFTADHYRLSGEIKEYARFMIESDLESPAASAGLMCIAEEAEFMCELWACRTKNDVEEDGFIMEVLEDDNLNVSNYIRQVVFHILSTYKGPSSDSLAASMLGMQKEANILRELLNGNRCDCFARLYVCDDIRPRLWKRLSLIARKIYPIDNPYTHITKWLPVLMPYGQGKESGNADEMGFPITNDGAAVLNTPTITTTTAPAAPVSWVVNVDEHDQENMDNNNNNNTKSMGDTQGSKVPISQTSDPSVVIGTAVNKRDGCRVWKRGEGYVEYELLQGVSPPYEQAEATRPDGPNAGEEEKHMLEKTSVVEEGSMKALVDLGKEIVALLKALLVVLVAVLCALCVVVYLLNFSRREIDV